MPTYLSSAVAYIEENGDELERARLAGLLGRVHPEPRILRSLALRQNDDGGYPYAMIPGRPSAVDSTVTGLRWMHDLRLSSAEYTERAVGYLLCMQRPEGTWDETPAVLKYDPPLQLRPGRSGGRSFWTALVAFWLARLIGPTHDTVVRAHKILRAQRDGAVSPDGLAATAVFITAVGALVDGPTAEGVVGALDTLAHLPPEIWTLEAVTDMLGAFAVARIVSDHSLLVWGVDRLRAAQRTDGGWTSDLGSDRDVDLSLRALSAFLALGVSAH
jgi:hypothetical protein